MQAEILGFTFEVLLNKYLQKTGKSLPTTNVKPAQKSTYEINWILN